MRTTLTSLVTVLLVGVLTSAAGGQVVYHASAAVPPPAEVSELHAGEDNPTQTQIGDAIGNTNQVFLFDSNGVYSGTSYAQLGTAYTASFGYRDGASDGTHVYFGWEDGVARHDADGSNGVILFDGTNQPGSAWRGLAYDPTGNAGDGSLWSIDWSSELVEVDLSGNVLTTFPNTSASPWATVYGLAYDATDGNLWASSQADPAHIIKISPSLGQVISGAGWPMANPPFDPAADYEGGLSGLRDGSGDLAYINQNVALISDEMCVYDTSGTIVGGVWDLTTQTGSIYHLGVAVTPEPATMTVLGIGAIAVLARRRRRRT